MENNDLLFRCQKLQRESARAGLDFLSTDTATALAFAESALQAENDSETRSRNQANARTGYDTVSRILNELSSKLVTEAEKLEVADKLLLLKSKLLELGEVIP